VNAIRGMNFPGAAEETVDKAALADPIGTNNSALQNRNRKHVQRTNECSPARWQSKEAPYRGGLS
jgi:hypothetical protein